MKFPRRVYTQEEVQRAKELLEKGYKHRLEVKGSSEFKHKVKEALGLIKTAEHYDFLQIYIRRIVEIGGFSQLREAEVVIWANKFTVADPVDAASYFIQMAQQMKDYVEGKPYYGGKAEARAVEKRIKFLEALREKSKNRVIKKRCEEILKSWAESTFL